MVGFQTLPGVMQAGARGACECSAALLQAGAGQSADARREWANAVLEALRTQSKLPGQASLPPRSLGKGPTHNPDTSSPSGAQNPSASSSAGPHAVAPPGMSFPAHTFHLQLGRRFGRISWYNLTPLCARVGVIFTSPLTQLPQTSFYTPGSPTTAADASTCARCYLHLRHGAEGSPR